MDKIIIYQVNLCTAGICAENNCTIDEIVNSINIKHPTGIFSRWQIAEDKPNKFKCPDFPTRQHWLLEC